MDKEWEGIIKILSEDTRETRALTKQVARQADAAEKNADAAMKHADAAMKQANAAWELIAITRSEWQDWREYLRRPWYKKLLGLP